VLSRHHIINIDRKCKEFYEELFSNNIGGGRDMKEAKGSRSLRADGNRSTPSTGPRAGAVGAKDRPECSKHLSRGTVNPVK